VAAFGTTKKKKPNYGLPKLAPGSLSGIGGLAPHTAAPDFFSPLSKSPQLQNLFSGLGGHFGSNNPYAGLIGGSADLSGIEAEMAAQGKADAAGRDAALRRFIVSYGSLPDFSQLGISGDALGYLKKAMDPKTQELAANAEKEGLSVHARQAHDDMVSRRQIPSQLAARGLLHSGQTGYDLGQQAQNYKTTQYDTLNELLGNIEGTVSSYQQAERDRQMQLAMARMQAASDAFGNWGDSDIGGSQSMSQQLAALRGTSGSRGTYPVPGASSSIGLTRTRGGYGAGRANRNRRGQHR
jgi:hypothetical protein